MKFSKEQAKTGTLKNGNPRANGRPKGVINKCSRIAKENIAQVFADLGGVRGMVAWANKSERNRETFYRDIYAKLIPLDVAHSGELSHVLRFDFGENGNGKADE